MKSNNSDSSDVEQDCTSEHSTDPSSSKTKRKESEHDDDNVKAIAKGESKAVFWMRMVVALVLVASTIAVSIMVYRYSQDTEQSLFQKQFESSADKVFEVLEKNFELFFGAADSFVVGIMDYARYSDSKFPFVTKPDFAVQSAKILALGNAISLREYMYVEEWQQEKWENYSTSNDAWVQEGIDIQTTDPNYRGVTMTDYYVVPYIHDDFGQRRSGGPFAPVWQGAPVVPIYGAYNWDGLNAPNLQGSLQEVLRSKRALLSETYGLPDPNDPVAVGIHNGTIDYFEAFIGDKKKASEPLSDVYYPMIDTSGSVVPKVTDDDKVVGILAITFFWRDLLTDLLPRESIGIIAVLQNDCPNKKQLFTFRLDGPVAHYVGYGDQHDTDYDHMMQERDVFDKQNFVIGGGSYTGIPLSDEFCRMKMKIYPSDDTSQQYISDDPLFFSFVAAAIFLFTTLVFVVYDRLAEQRQKVVMYEAVQSGKIVSSLFPSSVRDRLYDENEASDSTDQKSIFRSSGSSMRASMDASGTKASSAPIADLFPEATVFFADIAGFTAWSSIRDPVQVFTLLETLYGAFDKIAKQRGVFKVETIGDSYVACAGLPVPRKDHAVAVVRFARDCRTQMAVLTTELEVTLGPDTGNLKLRIGMHSGPVTAGVLRGEKSRFQLFGDTVNTASRMESNGIPSKMQCSQETADRLIEAGKGHWLQKRDTMIEAKGKGRLQTYWVEPQHSSGTSNADTIPSSVSDNIETAVSDAVSTLDEKTKRLVKWNVDTLCRSLKVMIADREARSLSKTTAEMSVRLQSTHNVSLPIMEVKDVIELPQTGGLTSVPSNFKSVEISSMVMEQLEDYVTSIAHMYPSNAFHNFEHASHVIMSVTKLLSRIITPDTSNRNDEGAWLDPTYGIASDAMTQFACGLCALIHDVDHPGVPNTQLIKESNPMAVAYENRSIAEQNSVDLGWNLLKDERFAELFHTLCPTAEEEQRLRELVVHIVLATDIMDPKLRELRNERWDKAFLPTTSCTQRQVANRKATIVLEYLIQASDVAHTMQHWHIFRQWNERLFTEMYAAFKAGRATKDPTEFWYDGELGFFDNYIIPLARKLEECGVFGVSSSEYLTYATANRREWAERGREVVALMKEKVQRHST